MVNRIVLATRKSPLALAQAELTAARLRAHFADTECELLKVVTTGDRKLEWSLEKQGGKGLFTAELEQALLRGDAQVAVHSSKDLPNILADGLVIAGYLPREDPRDLLVLRAGVTAPRTIATSSPRRRLQISLEFPEATFTEIRGNVDTRLKKIAAGALFTIRIFPGLKKINAFTRGNDRRHQIARPFISNRQKVIRHRIIRKTVRRCLQDRLGLAKLFQMNERFRQHQVRVKIIRRCLDRRREILDRLDHFPLL